MMGLLMGYQDDADRLAGKEKALTRGYNHDVRGLKAEAAPHETTVKDYNTQVEGFKKSAVHGVIDGKEELWQVIGWVRNFNEFDGQKVFNPVGAPGSNWQPANAGLYKGAYSGGLGYGFEGGWMWGSSPKATVRTGEGVALSNLDNQSMAPVNVYASWNDQPFVAPPTKSQIDTANAADKTLKGIGDRSDVMKAEFTQDRRPIEQRSERMADDIAMSAGRIREEQAPQAQSGSVFDQNMAGIHQSISDWLNA